MMTPQENGYHKWLPFVKTKLQLIMLHNNVACIFKRKIQSYSLSFIAYKELLGNLTDTENLTLSTSSLIPSDINIFCYPLISSKLLMVNDISGCKSVLPGYIMTAANSCYCLCYSYLLQFNFSPSLILACAYWVGLCEGVSCGSHCSRGNSERVCNGGRWSVEMVSSSSSQWSHSLLQRHHHQI